jgi:endoglucanase
MAGPDEARQPAGPTRRALLKHGLGLAAALAAGRLAPAQGASSLASLPLVGVNLASAEFGDKIPGRHGTDYMYPTAEDVAAFSDLGFTCFRIPFRWERLQPSLFGPLEPDELDRLSALVREIAARGITAILDPHNYAHRRLEEDKWTKDHLIGSTEVPIEAYLDFMVQLAIHFLNEERVAFGLMNEPYDISPEGWRDIANSTISAIRAAGASQLLLVPGTAFTGAHSWLDAGNSVLATIRDPLDHFAIEVHQYFDGNSSGTSGEVVSGSCGTERLRAFENWARSTGMRAFLGEFGAPSTRVGLNALSDICQEMSANPDIWLGWTAWAAGPFWPPDYRFNLNPRPSGETRAQTALLADYARPRSTDIWVRKGARLDLDLARERAYGCTDFRDVLEFSEPRTARSAQPGQVQLKGALHDLLNRAAFALVIEIEGFDEPNRNLEILVADQKPLLVRAPDGALRTSLSQTLLTEPQTSAAWRQRRRCLLSVDRRRGQFSISVTGARSVSGQAKVPIFDQVVISSTGDAGRIVRVTGCDSYIGGDTAAALIA